MLSTASQSGVQPRAGWRGQALRAHGGLLAAIVALWCGWWVEGERRLRRELALDRAEGVPEDLAAITPPPLPDEENAAVLVRAAIGLLPPDPSHLVGAGILLDDPWINETAWNAAQELAGASKPALEQLRAARDGGRVYWGPLSLTGPGAGAPLSDCRRLAKHAAVSAAVDHRRGDGAEGFATLLDALWLADAIRVHPTMIGALVADAIEGLVRTALSRMTAEIVEGRANPLARGSPARIGVEALLIALRDETTQRIALTQSLAGGRLADLEMLGLLVQGRADVQDMGLIDLPSPTAFDWRLAVRGRLLSPAYSVDMAKLLRAQRRWRAAATRGTWAACLELIPEGELSPTEWSETELGALLRPFSRDESAAGLCVTAFVRHRTERQMAAVGLAIALYYSDRGRLPDSLEALVPEYLPAEPRDPSAPRDAGFQYSPAPLRLACAGADQRPKTFWPAYFSPLRIEELEELARRASKGQESGDSRTDAPNAPTADEAEGADDEAEAT